MKILALVDQGAEFSPCRTWRYRLWRTWAEGPRLAVVGLNPSTADETTNDPTVTRCIGYARSWGFGGLVMLNLFAFRGTDPRTTLIAPDPVGPRNLDAIVEACLEVHLEGGAILAAWGCHGRHRGQGEIVKTRLGDVGLPVACLGFTKGGDPRHPLYLRRDELPVPFVGDGGLLYSVEWQALMTGAYL